MHYQENKKFNEAKTLRECNNHEKFHIYLGIALKKLLQLAYIIGGVVLMVLVVMVQIYPPMRDLASPFERMAFPILMMFYIQPSDYVFNALKLSEYRNLGKLTFFCAINLTIGFLPFVVYMLNA